MLVFENPVVHFVNQLACRPGETFGPRVNADFQWLYVKQGEGTILVGERRIEALPGDLIAYGPGQAHQISSSDDDPFILFGLHFVPDGELEPLNAANQLGILNVDASALAHMPTNNPNSELLPVHMHAGPWMLPYLEEMLREYLRNDAWSPLHLRGSLCRLYARLRREIAEQASSASPLVEQIRKLLETQAEHIYDMSWLEQCTGYSHDYASKMFKQAFSVSPHTYHQQMKLKAAQAYLENTTHSITEIAEQLQFSSIHYFCKWFRQLTGAAPRAYREKSRMI